MNYLFYSGRCEDSATLITLLRDKGLINMFNLVSIDDMSTDQIIKLGLSYTPAVVIREQNNMSSIFEGKKAFEWLERIVRFREENMARMVDMNRRRIVQQNAQQNQNNNILAFVPLETSGISDNFSYTADNLSDMAQPKSFMPYGGDGDFKIATFKEDQPKINKRELDSKIKEYSTKYKEQTNMLENIVETQMKHNLINKLSNQN